MSQTMYEIGIEERLARAAAREIGDTDDVTLTEFIDQVKERSSPHMSLVDALRTMDVVSRASTDHHHVFVHIESHHNRSVPRLLHEYGFAPLDVGYSRSSDGEIETYIAAVPRDHEYLQ